MCLELPMVFLQTALQYVISYFMMNLQGDWLSLVAISWALGVSSSSIAVLIGCMVSDVRSAVELTPILFIPQMLFMGFYIRTSLIPIFLRWAQYLCALKYAMNLVLLTEFSSSLASCKGKASIFCENLKSVNDVDSSMAYAYILILAALFVVFRVLGIIILVKKSKRFY
jgi:ABC-2 type transporter